VVEYFWGEGDRKEMKLTRWWYGLLVGRMEAAGATFIKVSIESE
jgi:hypothetical protein